MCEVDMIMFCENIIMCEVGYDDVLRNYNHNGVGYDYKLRNYNHGEGGYDYVLRNKFWNVLYIILFIIGLCKRWKGRKRCSEGS